MVDKSKQTLVKRKLDGLTSGSAKSSAADTFWKNVAQAGRGGMCHPLGNMENPVRLDSDKHASLLKIVLALLSWASGPKRINPGAENPDKNTPDPVSDKILQRSIKDNVKAGDWFYFSTEPQWLYRWTGRFIDQSYNTKTKDLNYFKESGEAKQWGKDYI